MSLGVGRDVNWLLRRRFLALLIALALLLLGYPMLQGVFAARLLFDALLTLVFLAALLVVFEDRRLRLLAFVLGLPTLVGNWTGYAVPETHRLHWAVAFHLSAALFLGFAVVALLRAVFRAQTVSADAIYGAFCGYILTGLAFGHVYTASEMADPGSIYMSRPPADLSPGGEQQFYLLTYFSYTTLTTVGYGDLTPARAATRGLAVIEAILGQFYIAVLIAQLVSKRGNPLPPDGQ
jgi:voltage-gated potassium channel